MLLLAPVSIVVVAVTVMFKPTSGANVKIDKLRIQIYDKDNSKLINESFYNVDYTIS